ncbi:MAG: 2,3,4,5-tetrahydropyridine-2,6-dicarboxylate N-succinyltransferase [Alphaproteobacteria bacterium]|nr:2,3,4,5-tetrahydropyridine-2,6-dicarboxylate N-succinyltransferase [Alphaproteobacteria bacterium]
MTDINKLKSSIEALWENRTNVTPGTRGEDRCVIADTLTLLNKGQIQVAEKKNGEWAVNEWIKKAVLLSFRINTNTKIESGDQLWWDKVPLKTSHWTDIDFGSAGFRAVPGAIIRHGAYIGPNAVLMPSFVNIGANVGEGTMIDTWATIGSCAQIGKNCHISGGVGIGGVLEPLQASPVIIEDNVFIGARSEVAEGVIVEEGAVLSMGVFLGASTKIIDRTTGDIFIGRVPSYSVVVPGTLPGQHAHLSCAVIVKRVDAQTRSKTSLNELLRD